MLLSQLWKPSSPVSSPYALEPLRSPPLATGYSEAADTTHDAPVAAELYSHACDADSRDDEKATTPLSALYGSLGVLHNVSCVTPPVSCASLTALSAGGAVYSDSLSPLPQLSPAVTHRPIVTPREAGTPSTNGSGASLIAAMNGSPPRVYSSHGTGARTFHHSNDAVPHSSPTLSRPTVISPFTLPMVEGERSGSPPPEVDQQQYQEHAFLPLPQELSLSVPTSSSSSFSFPSSHSSSLSRRRPMFGAHSVSQSLQRHSLLTPWAPSRHVPLHILADGFSTLASYPQLCSTFDEQCGNSYQPYPHSLHYHHADAQPANQNTSTSANGQQHRGRQRRAGKEEQQDVDCDSGANNNIHHTLDRAEANGELYSYNSIPLSQWPSLSHTANDHEHQSNHNTAAEPELHTTDERSGRNRRQFAPSSTLSRPTSSRRSDAHALTASVTVLPLSNGGSGDGSTESELSVPVHARVKAKRGRVVKRECMSPPLQSVVLSTIASSTGGRSHRSGAGAVRAARVISALQVDTSASISITANGWSLPGNNAGVTTGGATQRRKRTRSLSATSASSKPPQLPTVHSPLAPSKSSSSAAAICPVDQHNNYQSSGPSAPSAVTYDATPTHNSLKPKRYFCELCTKGFTQKGGLINHSRIHRNERPYSCGWAGCTRAFVQKCNLTRHERVHSGEKPYQCPVDGCGKRFNRKHGLAQHLIHHKTDTFARAQMLSAARPSGPSTHSRQMSDDDEQRQQQHDSSQHNGDQRRGSGSDDSTDVWQTVARRVHAMAATARTQASMDVAAGNGDVSYSSNGMSMPLAMFASIPLFPATNDQVQPDANCNHRPPLSHRQHNGSCGGE